jgi:hypothetical protein
MSLHDDNLPKNPQKIPDKITLKGNTGLNKATTDLIEEAIAQGVNSDTQIFSQFEKLLAQHQADTIANHEENTRKSGHKR